MGEIRTVSPGKTRGYPYPVCKNNDCFSGMHISSPLSEHATSVQRLPNVVLTSITSMTFGQHFFTDETEFVLFFSGAEKFPSHPVCSFENEALPSGSESTV